MPRSPALPLAGLALAAALLSAPAFAQQGAAPSGVKEASTVKEALGRMWARLRAATPRPQAVASTQTVTAGLRGSEATETELKPQWHGDRESAAERQALDKAQAAADAGSFAEAAAGFDAFLRDHPRSAFRANALFGVALARAALGERERAIAGFEEFIRTQPQHALLQDAEQALQALR